MCRGLPGSGKSTWASTQKGYVIVDSDMIRRGNFDPKFEELVQIEKISRIRRALKEGNSVISTDPNLLPRHERALRALASRFKAEFEIKYFDVPVEECIKRDALREKKVGERAIRYWNDRKASIQSE